MTTFLQTTKPITFFSLLLIMEMLSGSLVGQTTIWTCGFELANGVAVNSAGNQVVGTNCNITTAINLTHTDCIPGTQGNAAILQPGMPGDWLTGGPTGVTAQRRPWRATGQLQRTGSYALRFDVPASAPYSGWIVTHGTNLDANVPYVLEFYYRIHANAGTRQFRIYAGATTNQTTMPSTPVQIVNSTDQDSYAPVSFTFTPLSSGTYYFALMVTAASSGSVEKVGINIDDMSLTRSYTLPVTITNFSSECEDNLNLRWTTVSEQNASHFNLQRSLDGYTWETIESVPAKGNSSVENNYEVIDTKSENIVYYRLHQMDFDGKEKIFNTISVNCAKEIENTVTVVPNPIKNNFVVNITSTRIGTANMQIVDLSGKIVYTEIINLTKGSNMLFVNDAGLASGIYMLNIESTTDRFHPVKLIYSN